MSKQNTFENDVLSLFLTATAIANLADNAASAPITNIQISLHTADPGEAGDQTTSEATYTGYARVPIARTTAGWTVTSGIGDNDNVVTFGQCTAGSSTITHFGVGTGATGAGKLLWSGTTNSLAVTAGITPTFPVGDLNVTED